MPGLSPGGSSPPVRARRVTARLKCGLPNGCHQAAGPLRRPRDRSRDWGLLAGSRGPRRHQRRFSEYARCACAGTPTPQTGLPKPLLAVPAGHAARAARESLHRCESAARRRRHASADPRRSAAPGRSRTAVGGAEPAESPRRWRPMGVVLWRRSRRRSAADRLNKRPPSIATSDIAPGPARNADQGPGRLDQCRGGWCGSRGCRLRPLRGPLGLVSSPGVPKIPPKIEQLRFGSL